MVRLLYRFVLSTLTTFAVVAAGGVVAAPPAAATVTTLCTGYAACARAGMTSAGYAQPLANGTMYWRMYSGHNCTNYAAYRMVRSGLPNERPWSGGGNATYWGQYMGSITDSTPRVGAVAWWRAGVYPAGSAGHVAYVERVVSADEIIVSQDSWGGDFSWARITRDTRGWPSGFVHFNDVPLENTAKPAINGVVKVGATLTATAGSWDPGTVTTAYQWRGAGMDIPGATSSTFKVPRSLLGKRINVEVTASKLGYPTTTVAAGLTPQVQPGELSTPTAPQVGGVAEVDSELVADVGAWQPTPDSLSVRWLADGTPVPGADDETFTPGPALVGKVLKVQVTAHKAGYADTVATSAPTPQVDAATFETAQPPVLAGAPRLGETMSVDPGSVTPATEAAVQWFRGNTRIPGATGTAYVLTTDDLGHRVLPRLRWVRPGYHTLTVQPPRLRRVKAVPHISVATRTGKAGLTFTIGVTAVGTDPVPGTVLIRRAGQVVAETSLTDGRAVATVTGVPSGRRTFRVVVHASRTVARGAVTREVTIG